MMHVPEIVSFQIGQPGIGAEFPGRSKVGAAGRMSVGEGPVTYGVEVNGQLRKRHADQLLDQRGHMAKQPATSITGLSDP